MRLMYVTRKLFRLWAQQARDDDETLLHYGRDYLVISQNCDCAGQKDRSDYALRAMENTDLDKDKNSGGKSGLMETNPDIDEAA